MPKSGQSRQSFYHLLSMKTVLKLSLALALIMSISANTYGQLNWVLKNETGSIANVENNGKYLLVNQTNNSPLKYGKRSKTSKALGCINIVWGGSSEKLSSSNFVNVVRQPGKSGPIQTGERIALRLEGGGYLAYEKKTVGINLGWVSSDTKDVPYIWEIRYMGNKIGETLKTNSSFAIYCHKNDDWLVYCKRTDPGINLGWTTSCSGCSRGGYDWARDILPKVKEVIGEVKSRKPDAGDLGDWCTQK